MEIFTKDLLSSPSSLIGIEEQVYDGEVNMMYYHTHDHYELMCITQGKRLICIGNENFELNQGNISLLPPYLAHKSSSLGPGHVRRILINFKKAYLAGFLPDDSILDVFNADTHLLDFNPETIRTIHEIFEEILQLYLYENYYKDFQIKLKLCELLIMIHKNGIADPQKKFSSDIHKKFASIAHYINNNCQNKITLDMVSETFEIDKFQLSRHFKTHLGASFVTYVNTVRITRARRMMVSGISNVTDIAFANGFDSPTHFSRVFKSMVGKTPKQYMREVHNEILIK